MSGQAPIPPLKIGSVALGGRVLIAPMTGVTDLPFRRAAVRAGASYVATEMVASADFAKGRPDIVRKAAGGDDLPLMVVQLVGADPLAMANAAKLAEAAGAHLIDINMGCPAKEVVGVRSGAALMRDLNLAERLIAATTAVVSVPVTVKMRLGWDPCTQVAPHLAEIAARNGASGVTVHGRTRSQFYSGNADWGAVRDVVRAVAIPVSVNGDIVDVASARAALSASGAAAVMMGRGVYGQPWAAGAIDQALAGQGDAEARSQADILEAVLVHFAETLRFYGDGLGLKIFRKHLGWYVERACSAGTAEGRRAAKARLCRIENPNDLVADLSQFWRDAA